MATTATASLPKMRAALRHLCEHGELAFQQQKSGQRWRKAMVSKRVAADLRKAAIIGGTYGSFDSKTGVGWDPKWDNPGRMPSLRAPKHHKRERTREQRAVNIETKMSGMPQAIEEHYQMLQKRKPEPTFENYLKKLMSRVKLR